MCLCVHGILCCIRSFVLTMWFMVDAQFWMSGALSHQLDFRWFWHQSCEYCMPQSPVETMDTETGVNFPAWHIVPERTKLCPLDINGREQLEVCTWSFLDSTLCALKFFFAGFNLYLFTVITCNHGYCTHECNVYCINVIKCNFLSF